MTGKYQVCNRCVMDTTDPEIQFDEKGICNHCRQYDESIKRFVFDGEAGKEKLQHIIDEIKVSGTGKEYDCIIGVSGGVDSSFVAYKVKEFGLRPLAVHLDNGWDSELAVKNIELFLKKLDIDLYTHVIDWDEFKDLQLSFLYASTPDSEIPSDHAIHAILFHVAENKKIKYIIFGSNVRTESHLPKAWSQGHFDWKYIESIHNEYGFLPLTTFPHMNFFAPYRYFFTHKSIAMLNYLEYSKNDAMKILENELGWKYYGGKHYESIYTRFYQGYILPKKFGYDKRRVHLSSLICSGEITRSEALEELKNEPYPAELQSQDKEYVIKKFRISDEEFDRIMNLPKRKFEDFPSYGNSKIYIAMGVFFRILGKMFNLVKKGK
ncbi:MAG: N-acetyl sugar amidotransferase [Methanoregula sp.]